jgi:hypothetical protein
MDLFAQSHSRAQHVAEIKEWVVRSLGLDADASVMVTELRCREEGCPPLETVIAVFPLAGPKIQLKLHRPLAEVTPEEISRVCMESLSQSPKEKE